MDEAALRGLLTDVRSGACTADDAVATIRRLPYADLGFARVDHHRTIRQGLSETVYGPGKTPAQCVAIVDELLAASDLPVIVSRASAEQVDALLAAQPGATRTTGPDATMTLVWRAAPPRTGSISLLAAGTADLPVADECAAVLTANGVAAGRVTDVGVAGLHRLVDALPAVQSADVVIVVAGMEGALASVVGGLTAAPVVAVPTSVGYGAALEGVTALLAMLSSCAAGITVVGIDNGYGAACAALRILGPPTS
ncbi:MAG: nickel pincer cofactor biosynthesis protein LarB [Acidimicrobiales bacterium]